MRDDNKQLLERERGELLHQLEEWLETPMLVLGFVWLALLVLELTRGLNAALETAVTVIWIVFILDFALRFTLAPRKVDYLQANWLTVISLLLPALRVFRIVRVFRVLRAARAARGLRLVKIIGSLNRGMRALGRTMGRRGFGYVAALTLLVTLAGAAGMYYFERGYGIDDYGTALWWTAMMMTTMGSDYWPQTAEGRVLCLVLALYAFGVFGYVTATIASFFLGRDAENPEGEVAGAAAVEALRREIAALQADVGTLLAAVTGTSGTRNTLQTEPIMADLKNAVQGQQGFTRGADTPPEGDQNRKHTAGKDDADSSGEAKNQAHGHPREERTGDS